MGCQSELKAAVEAIHQARPANLLGKATNQKIAISTLKPKVKLRLPRLKPTPQKLLKRSKLIHSSMEKMLI